MQYKVFLLAALLVGIPLGVGLCLAGLSFALIALPFVVAASACDCDCDCDGDRDVLCFCASRIYTDPRLDLTCCCPRDLSL